MEAAILAAMHKADLPPEFSYAYRKTGLLGLAEDKSAWPPESIKEWNDAVDEYRAIQAASVRPDKPNGWNTQITELQISPFTQQDYDQVGECVSAIAPIEARGMKVVTRMKPMKFKWDGSGVKSSRSAGRCACSRATVSTGPSGCRRSQRPSHASRRAWRRSMASFAYAIPMAGQTFEH